MADIAKQIAEAEKRLKQERSVRGGILAMKAASPNPDVQQGLEAQLKASDRNMAFLQAAYQQLIDKRDGGAGAAGGGGAAVGASGAGGQGAGFGRDTTDARQRPLPLPPGQSSPSDVSRSSQGSAYGSKNSAGPVAPGFKKQTYSNLDLLKYDTPLTVLKISRMLYQLDFKLRVERQYKTRLDQMAKLYQADGDRKSKAEAQVKGAESEAKLQLLEKALKHYTALNVLGDSFDQSNDPEDRKGNLRKPLTGTLQITIVKAQELSHAPTKGKGTTDTVVVIKVEDAPQGRTHSSKNDFFNEYFEIPVDKANEVEIAIYDKVSGYASPVPIGFLWFRLSDIAEELRRKRVENEGAPGWVPAERVNSQGAGGGGGGGGGGISPTASMDTPMNQQQQQQGFAPGVQSGQQAGPNAQSEPIKALFAIEPTGAIELELNFVKSNVRKRPYDTGALGRQGAVRRKGETFLQNGHKFVQRQFYAVVQCALCSEFIKNGATVQCEDCRFLCHEKCYKSVVTKCISKSNVDTDKDEDKINHRIPHRFEPSSNLASWCCHCGMYVAPFKKVARKCTECGKSAHADCTHLVPDFCGLSMQTANIMLAEKQRVNEIKKTPRPSSGGIRRPTTEIPPGPQRQSTIDESAAGQPYPQGRPPQQDPYGRTQSYPSSPSSPATSRPLPSAPGQGGAPADPNRDSVGSIVGSYGNQIPSAADQYALPADQYAQQQLPPPPQGAQQPVPPAKGPWPANAGAPPGSRPPAGFDPRLQIPQAVPIGLPPQAAGLPPQQQQQLAAQQQQQQAAAAAQRRQRKYGLNDFNFIAVLGKGNFGKVMLAEERRSNRLYAIKVLKKGFIIENDEVDSTKSEKRVFLAAARERHPFLLNLHSCFQTETRIYFVMDYVSGGDLMLHIQREPFTPRRAKFYAAEVLLALEYFHKNGIVYRDLKLDNILLGLDGHVKVADYGLCKENMYYGDTTGTFCGTPEFMAPEIVLDQRYGRAVDWWAFGVLIYEMLLGMSPFRGDDEDEIFDAIVEDEPLYPVHMPKDSVSILTKLLTRDPARRLGAGPDDAEEIKRHPFFKDVNWDDIENKRVVPPFFPETSGDADTRNFDPEFTRERPTLTPVHTTLTAEQQREFGGFSWTAPWANE